MFDRIEGRTGRDLIGGDLGCLLSTLGNLHRAHMGDLPRYDPLLRVRPRLALTAVAALRGIVDEPVPPGSATLHGDLHVGQFILEKSGTVWIVDLDDLAVGPPEADLAGFTAHLATTLPGCGIAAWSGRLCRTWVGQGCNLDRTVFAQFLRFALLRRHLKLREAGRPDFEAQILAYLRESASLSIR